MDKMTEKYLCIEEASDERIHVVATPGRLFFASVVSGAEARPLVWLDDGSTVPEFAPDLTLEEAKRALAAAILLQARTMWQVEFSP